MLSVVLSECGRNATHAKDIDPAVGICAQAQQYTENRETLIKFLRDAGHTAEVIQQIKEVAKPGVFPRGFGN